MNVRDSARDCDFCEPGTHGGGCDEGHTHRTRTLVVEGFIDNGFYGDSDIFVTPKLGYYADYPRETPDLDLVFKALQGERVRVTVELLP